MRWPEISSKEHLLLLSPTLNWLMNIVGKHICIEYLCTTCSNSSRSIFQFLNNCLINNHKSDNSSLSGRVYDIIQELNLVAPSMLQPIFPQLEFKLKVVRPLKLFKALALYWWLQFSFFFCNQILTFLYYWISLSKF